MLTFHSPCHLPAPFGPATPGRPLLHYQCLTAPRPAPAAPLGYLFLALYYLSFLEAFSDHKNLKFSLLCIIVITGFDSNYLYNCLPPL